MNRQIDHDRMVVELKAENARLKELNHKMLIMLKRIVYKEPIGYFGGEIATLVKNVEEAKTNDARN